MGVISYSVSWNVAPKMSHGVLACDIVTRQSDMLPML